MCFNVTTFSKDASIVQPQTLKIDKSTLFGMNFFNDIKFNSVNANNKRRDCYSILKFKRDSQDNKKWVLQKGGISDYPYEYEVYDNVNGTNYRIYKGDKIIEI